MTSTSPDTTPADREPFHLTGNHRPVGQEVTAFDLPLSGRLPDALDGSFLRNGPNPRGRPGHWFLGDGMLHGVRLQDGEARWYRNRWVRTTAFSDGARLVGDDLAIDLTAGPANTHVVRHAGRTLALVESTLPYEVTPELDTVGPYDFGGRLTTAMTAHPKICPATGELHFFGYGFFPPFLTYHRADASGQLVVSREVEVPGATMIHDMALTERYVAFLDLPVVFDLERAMAGTMPYRWDDDYGARVGLLRRDDPQGAVRWFEVADCYVFHVLNAFDHGDRVVLDVVRYERLWDRTPDEFSRSELWRWELDLGTGRVGERRLDDGDAEFPRIDDRLAGSFAERGWVTTSPAPGAAPQRGEASNELAVFRLGLPGGPEVAGVQRWAFGPGETCGEAVFAPADDTPGGPGWLLTFVHDAATDSSDLAVFAAEAVDQGPVARVHLPQRVPVGFHGSWLPEY